MYSPILHGRRSIIKWRISMNSFENGSAFSNSFSSANAANVRAKNGLKGQNFTASYLVDSLGLSTKLAESISKKVRFEEKGNPDSVLSLLRSHGFTDSQISSIITIYPRLLIADAEKSLGPKLQFLQSKGASTSELTEIVSKVPQILGKRVGKTIRNYYDLVKDIIETDKSSKFVMLRHSLPQGSNQENKFRNLLVLRELGVPQHLLFSLLIISNGSILCGKERFEESLNKVVEMGIDPTTSMFVNALKVVQSLSDKTLEGKVNIFKRLGFAEGDVWEMFKKWPLFLVISEKNLLNSVETFLGLGFIRDEFLMMVKRFPLCLNYSDGTVKKKTVFLVKMGWPLEAVTLLPQVFSYSMEKRIVPRCNVIRALMSKELLKGNKLPPMSSVLKCTNQVFLNRYVRKHDDDKELVAELMSIFITGEDRVS